MGNVMYSNRIRVGSTASLATFWTSDTSISGSFPASTGATHWATLSLATSQQQQSASGLYSFDSPLLRTQVSFASILSLFCLYARSLLTSLPMIMVRSRSLLPLHEVSSASMLGLF
jgi:hypothetical protein